MGGVGGRDGGCFGLGCFLYLVASRSLICKCHALLSNEMVNFFQKRWPLWRMGDDVGVVDEFTIFIFCNVKENGEQISLLCCASVPDFDT